MNFAVIAQTIAFAQGTADPATSGRSGSPLGMISSILPIVLIMVVMYFLMLRPQMKKQKQHSAMIAALRKGDDVVTAGGIHGRIVHAAEKESTLQIQIARGIVVTVERSSVAHKTSQAMEVSATENRQSDARRSKPESSGAKENWPAQSGSAVVTSSGRSNLEDTSEVSSIVANEPNNRRSRHRRFRRRRSNYQPNREATPNSNPPQDQSG